MEWEYAVTRVSAIQPPRIIGTPSGVEIGTDERTVRAWPRWSTLRAGVELPLAGQ